MFNNKIKIYIFYIFKIYLIFSNISYIQPIKKYIYIKEKS